MSRSARDILHNQYNLCVCFNHVIQFTDVGVVDALHDFDFSAD